jgi:hypothetical protein
MQRLARIVTCFKVFTTLTKTAAPTITVVKSLKLSRNARPVEKDRRQKHLRLESLLP